jgi:DNA-binding XRE family transcriptional regulator
MASVESEDMHGENAAVWLIPRCKTWRESAGMRIQQLALEAKVDRATITKIEKHKGISKPLAYRVFNVLNKRHRDALEDTVEITDNPRKR